MQMPQQLAKVGFATAGVVSSTRPTSRRSTIHEEQTMQCPVLMASNLIHALAVFLNKPESAGSSGSHK
jgi:hypothetical protein